jgi:hypothetical protein
MLYQGATFDRTVAAVRLADTGVAQGVVDDSYRVDLAGVGRLVARSRHVTRGDEREVFGGRYFTIQPNLDESSYRGSLRSQTARRCLADRVETGRCAPCKNQES